MAKMGKTVLDKRENKAQEHRKSSRWVGVRLQSTLFTIKMIIRANKANLCQLIKPTIFKIRFFTRRAFCHFFVYKSWVLNIGRYLFPQFLIEDDTAQLVPNASAGRTFRKCTHVHTKMCRIDL